MVDREAVTRKYAHRDKVLMMDRKNWTRDQWVQDAFDIMADPDGSSISLMNGHVRALLSEVEELRGRRSASDLEARPGDGSDA
jgi:hypothetical protein